MPRTGEGRLRARVATVAACLVGVCLPLSAAATARPPAAHPDSDRSVAVGDQVPERPRPADGLLGEWRLVDDDALGPGEPPEGFLVLGRDGRWRLTGGGDTVEGRFFVERGELVLTTVVDGNTRVDRRRFTLDGDDLRLANRGGGEARYKRVR